MLTVDVVPEPDAIFEELSGLAQSELHLSLAGRHDAVITQETVPSVQDGIQHGLVQQGVAHPFGDDDVDLLEAFGERDVLDFPADDAE